MKKLYVPAALLLASFALTPAAFAQATWSAWNLANPSTTTTSTAPSNGCQQATAHSGTYGNSYLCGSTSAPGMTATISAWSADRGADVVINDVSQQQAAATNAWYNAFVSPQGSDGFGVGSRSEGTTPGSPNHSIDNIHPGTYDFVMVQFSSAVILSQIGIGWAAGDSDATVMRWTGDSAPTFGTASASVGSNATLSRLGGWQLVGNYSNICRDSNGTFLTGSSNNCDSGGHTNSRVDTGALGASSYWLISAFNNDMAPGVHWTNTNDGFKLNFLKTSSFSCPGGGSAGPGGGCTPGRNDVPAPGSLALAGLGMLGLWATRRRREQPVR